MTAAVLLLVLYAAAFALGAGFMPSYLAAWLFVLSIPVGALPVVMGLELAGFGDALHSGFLRWLLVLMPLAALAGLPIPFFLPALYPWARHALPGIAGWWFSPLPFALRSLAYLALWTGLAAIHLRPPQDGSRRILCAAGLALHVVVGTMAATDWIMSLRPGLDAAGFGLLVMTGQAALALSVALLLLPVKPPGAPALLLAALCSWAMLQFTQYLIVWSADLPTEIAWYISRGGMLGGAFAWSALASVLLPVLLLRQAGWSGRRRVTAGCATLVILVQMAGMLWLVTPSVRGSFTLSPPDVLAILGAALLAAGVLWIRRPAGVTL